MAHSRSVPQVPGAEAHIQKPKAIRRFTGTSGMWQTLNVSNKILYVILY